MLAWGCIHIDTSPGTRVWVPVNTSLRVFQYEYELPVNFTRTSSFWTGRVFIKPVRCKQCKICSNLFTRAMSHILHHKLHHCWVVIWWRCEIRKIINDVVEYCYFFAKHSVDSIFLEIVCRHVLSCPCTSDHERSLVWVKLLQAVNWNPDSELVLVSVWT